MSSVDRPSFSAAPVPRAAASGAGSLRSWLLSGGFALAVLLAMAVAGMHLAQTMSPTSDEPGHLSAGLAALRGDFRQSTGGNLFFSQEWAALGLARRAVKPPDASLQERLKWQPNLLGVALLYGGDADPLQLLTPARRMTLLLCVFGGFMVWAWAGWLAGPWAGAFALLLYATSPVILGNGVLVTTETSTAFWYAAAVFGYGGLLRKPRALSGAVSGFSAAMLLLTKFSFPAWVLAAGLLLAWQMWRQREELPLPALLRAHGVAAIVGWVTIWTFFGWSYRPGGFVYVADDFAPANLLEHVVLALKEIHFLPEPLLRDMLSVQGTVHTRPGYLFGDFKLGGHVLYFPVAFATKSTLALLAALLAGLALLGRGAKAKTGRMTPVWIAPLVAGIAGYALLALFSSLNIGVRHILPIFVLATIVGGVVLARLLRFGPWARVAAIAIALLAVAEGVSARRQPLAWFNFLAGGPMNGYRIMIDSSLDWGADLPELDGWIARLRATDSDTPVYSSVMRPETVTYPGMKSIDLEQAFMAGEVWPGYFVFSATLLIAGPEKGDQAGAANRVERWNEFVAPRWQHTELPAQVAQVGVGRLAAACRQMKPAERIGPVYFVYHLDQAELDRILGPKPR